MLELADRTGLTFTWQRWKAGGPNEALGGYIFAAPDNLSFDKAGNMWVVSDISSTRLNSDSWRSQRHALVERPREPRGSNWPHREHRAPLPGVVAIERR